MAELAIGLILSVLRFIVQGDAASRSGKTRQGIIGNELRGKTVGIVGTGSIGSAFAELAMAFGCSILAWSRTEKKELSAKGIRYVPLDELLAGSDIVSLHLPLTAETSNLLSREKIALMKKGAILINTARGGIVDNAALAEALGKGDIAGAGIDVLEMEPPFPADHPILGAPNTVIMPHVAFATHEALLARAGIVFENILEWLTTQRV